MRRRAAGLLGSIGWAVPLLVAGVYLYQAEQIPVIWIGRREIVPRHALEKLLLG